MSVLLSVEDVSEMLGVSASWIRQRYKAGEIKCVRLGTRVKFKPEDIEAYVESQRS